MKIKQKIVYINMKVVDSNTWKPQMQTEFTLCVFYYLHVLTTHTRTIW